MIPNVPLWEDGQWSRLPTLSGDVDADACVIGLGGTGLACIQEFLAAGVRVVGLDAGPVAGGAAGRNGGILRAGLATFHHEAIARHGPERAARLYRLTAGERERDLREFPHIVRRTGYLRLAHDAEERRDCRAHLDALRADGFQAEWHEGPTGSGVLLRDEAACNPLARCRHVARLAMAAGARLYEHSPAVALSGDAVETPAGRVRCRRVVVCADGGLATLLPELADRVRPVRLQMLGTAPVPPFEVPAAVSCRWGWDYWQQHSDGRVAVGGCRDVGGDDEWVDDGTPTTRVQEALDRLVHGRLGVTAPVTHRWGASVSYTDTALPVLAEVRPSVWGVGAYSGTGNLLGPVCGRAAARLALGRETSSPLD